MSIFIVNKNQQRNGDHEVHNKTTGCTFMPDAQNQLDLGSHATCYGAVQAAKMKWPSDRINGCFYCCNACHTS